MASQTIAATVLAQEYAGDIISQINRKSATLRVLPIVMGQGKNLAWAAESDAATAAAMAEGASAGTPTVDAQASATLNWAFYKSDTGVTGPAAASAATTSTPQGNVNQLRKHVTNAVAKVASTVNGHLYSGDGSASPKQVTGFDQAIGDTTNTYATIDRSSATYWRPYLANPGSATNVSLGQIREDIKEIEVQCGEPPQVAMCHPGVFNEVGNLFDANRLYLQTVTELDTPRGRIELRGGYTGIEVNGCVFLKDKDATLESGNGSGRIYYLNLNYVELQVLPDPRVLGLLESMGLEPQPGDMLTANDGFGDIPLMIAVEKMAKTADADTFMAKVYCELKVSKPHAFGVRRFVNLNF